MQHDCSDGLGSSESFTDNCLGVKKFFQRIDTRIMLLNISLKHVKKAY